MPAPKKNKAHVKPTDGRKHNKGVTTRNRKQSKMTPAKLNKAKRRRLEGYAINSIISQFDSEVKFFDWLAERATKSNFHLKLLMEYAYGDPRDIDRSTMKEDNNKPKVVFIDNTKTEKIIEIDHNEEE